MTPTLLAFDTSGDLWSAALTTRGRVYAIDSELGVRASAQLVPAVLALLADAGLGLSDLDAIAFGRGPGAFTGLRTACSVAQGLAFGADKPVLPIDTLMAVAEDARTLAGAVQRVWVVMDARMDEVYAAQYEQASDRWSVVDAPRLTNPQALQALWRAEPPQAVAGSALDAFGERLDTGGALRVAAARPRAAAMLPLARALWLAGGAVDAALALPLYVRDRVALTTLERDAARSAKLAAESAR